jgi:hypothetical protein
LEALLGVGNDDVSRLLTVLDATPQQCEMIRFMLRRSVAIRTACIPCFSALGRTAMPYQVGMRQSGLQLPPEEPAAGRRWRRFQLLSYAGRQEATRRRRLQSRNRTSSDLSDGAPQSSVKVAFVAQFSFGKAGWSRRPCPFPPIAVIGQSPQAR